MKNRCNVFSFLLTEKEIEAIEDLKNGHLKLLGIPENTPIKMSDLIRHSLFYYKMSIDASNNKTETEILKGCENYHNFSELKCAIIELKTLFNDFEKRKNIVEKMYNAVVSEEEKLLEKAKNKLKKIV